MPRLEYRPSALACKSRSPSQRCGGGTILACLIFSVSRTLCLLAGPSEPFFYNLVRNSDQNCAQSHASQTAGCCQMTRNCLRQTSWAQGSIGMGHLRPCPVGQQQEQADLSRGEAGMDLDSKGLRREGMSAGIVLSRRHLHGGNWDRGVWKNPNRSPPERLNFTHCRECDTSSQQCRPSRNFPAPILSLSPAPERRGCSPE